MFFQNLQFLGDKSFLASFAEAQETLGDKKNA
jgi:hypothetical protein